MGLKSRAPKLEYEFAHALQLYARAANVSLYVTEK